MRRIIALLSLVTLVGCSSKDVDTMTRGLVASGMPKEQAQEYATGMKSAVKKGPYNYMAKLMVAGESEKSAINRARRKYGADFKKPMLDVRNEVLGE